MVTIDRAKRRATRQLTSSELVEARRGAGAGHYYLANHENLSPPSEYSSTLPSDSDYRDSNRSLALALAPHVCDKHTDTHSFQECIYAFIQE